MSVKLMWVTPNGEQLIADMARVSAPENVGKDASKLMAYCIRNEHWSPFEMANMCLEINTTRDIARQILRHRSFSFQEFSQRYAEVTKLDWAELREARLQDPKNRQNSIDEGVKDIIKAEWLRRQAIVRDTATAHYNWALSVGIAKEVARAALPEGLTSSRIYMNGTVRSWMHYIRLRSGNGTQKEHMLIAQQAGVLLEQSYPNIYKALIDTAN